MANTRTQRAQKRRRRSSDHPLRAFSDPDHQTDMRALVDALTLHAETRRAEDEDRAPGLLAGVNKLAEFRPTLDSLQEVDHA